MPHFIVLICGPASAKTAKPPSHRWVGPFPGTNELHTWDGMKLYLFVFKANSLKRLRMEWDVIRLSTITHHNIVLTSNLEAQGSIHIYIYDLYILKVIVYRHHLYDQRKILNICIITNNKWNKNMEGVSKHASSPPSTPHEIRGLMKSWRSSSDLGSSHSAGCFPPGKLTTWFTWKLGRQVPQPWKRERWTKLGKTHFQVNQPLVFFGG